MKKALFATSVIIHGAIFCAENNNSLPHYIFEKLLLSAITIEQGINQINNEQETQQAQESLIVAAEIMAKALHDADEEEENMLRDIIEKHAYYPYALVNAENFLEGNERLSSSTKPYEPIEEFQNYETHRAKSLAALEQNKNKSPSKKYLTQ